MRQSIATNNMFKYRKLAVAIVIALGIFMLHGLEQAPILLVWGIYFVVLSVYLGASYKISSDIGGMSRLRKGVGLAVLVLGITSLAGASFGNRDLFKPLPQLGVLLHGSAASGVSLSNHQTKNLFSVPVNLGTFDSILAQANADGKPVFIEFYADWCLDCKRMERTTLSDSTIVERLARQFVNIKIDVTDPHNEFSRSIRKRYQVFGPPAIVLVDKSGAITEASPAYGYMNVDELMLLLSEA